MFMRAVERLFMGLICVFVGITLLSLLIWIRNLPRRNFLEVFDEVLTRKGTAGRWFELLGLVVIICAFIIVYFSLRPFQRNLTIEGW